VKRNLKRNILIRKGVPYREYRITFPPLEDAVLRRVTLHTVHDIRPFTTPGFTIAEHSALYLTPTADGGLDVVVETGPDYPAGDKKKDRGKFWTAYGEMIYGTLHSRVGSASAGLSQALLAPSRRGRRVWLTDKFQPEGRWQWLAPTTHDPGRREAYWHRAAVTLSSEELLPISVEEMLNAYIKTGPFPFFGKTIPTVVLTYCRPKDPHLKR
jgi:hypothetical protein